jgi:phosphate-selective porin OprO/OprP
MASRITRFLLGLAVLAGPARGRADEPAADAPPAAALAAEPTPAPTARLRGRIEADAVLASQSAASKLLLGDLQNGYGFRRARLGAEGKLGGAGEYVAEVDFAGGSVRLRDVFVGLTALPGVREARVGYFREPFSLEGATSSRFITFLERSPLNQLDPTRNWGVAGYWWPDGERLTVAVGAFRTGTDGTGFSGGDEDAWAVTARLTGLPVDDLDADAPRLVHVGAAFSHRSPAGGVVRYAQQPQSSLLALPDNPASPFLPPIDIPAAGQQLYNLQAAGVYGPASVQAEWFGTAIERQAGGVVFLHGFYAYGSLFLTGEHRGYSRTRAAFDRVVVRRPLVRTDGRPAAGFGAVELTARVSVADFASPGLAAAPPAGTPGPTAGTVLYQATWGANWYLNDYVRLMFNYTLAVPAVRGAPALPVHVFGLRTAVYW